MGRLPHLGGLYGLQVKVKVKRSPRKDCVSDGSHVLMHATCGDPLCLVTVALNLDTSRTSG